MSPGASSPARHITRRQFLTLAGAAAAAGGIVVAGADLVRNVPATGRVSGATPGAGAASPSATPSSPAVLSAAASAAPVAPARRRFRSRPDLAPPFLEVTTREASLAPGLIFLTPANGADRDGPTILDDAGELVWMRPDTAGNATGLRVATYRGSPVLTWWEGANNAGIGTGEHVIMDASYREVARVRGGNGRTADLHELLLTDRDTALLLADAGVDPIPVPDQIPPRPRVMDCAIQEVDLGSGRVLFEWHAVDHLDVAESVVPAPTAADQLYDYVHANSIDVDTDGNLLLSARNTSAIYKIDRLTGRILWRLGGRRSDFAMGPGATFALQHDARRQPDGTLSIFDDGEAPGTSRAIALRLDETAMTATLERELRQPQGLLATSQGNMQVLPDGHTFVGWGSLPRFSEFDTDGRLLYDATFSATQSYRDLRFPWVGRPSELPDVAVDTHDGTMAVFASWNGATEVATWEIMAGRSAAALHRVAAVPRAGFETQVSLPLDGPLVAVRARDAAGVILGTSQTVDTGD
jgi:Arylsulfotransferase (ASST)